MSGEPEKVMLYHKLKVENLKIISDKTNYLDIDTAITPIVEFVCDKCNLPIGKSTISIQSRSLFY